MAETLKAPRLDKLDMDNARALVMADIQNTIKNGSFAVQDVLHTVAYQGETLGAPLMCSPHTAEAMTGDVIANFKVCLCVLQLSPICLPAPAPAPAPAPVLSRHLSAYFGCELC